MVLQVLLYRIIGEGKQKKKRGFATRKEASEWKRNFLIKEK